MLRWASYMSTNFLFKNIPTDKSNMIRILEATLNFSSSFILTLVLKRERELEKIGHIHVRSLVTLQLYYPKRYVEFSNDCH